MTNWSLTSVLGALHDDIEKRLAISRGTFAHTGTKGDASESVWVSMLENYLPRRYNVMRAHVVDSKGAFSEQIDVVVFDRQYSPFILSFEGQTLVPAESVYAVFEAKQTVNAELVRYAQSKVSSVRKLHRTSLPIPHAGGTYPARPLPKIYGGVLSLDSDWSPALGDALRNVLAEADEDGRLDFGCVAANGAFYADDTVASYNFREGRKPATAFLLELIARLQASATVPMIDIRAYAQWLD